MLTLGRDGALLDDRTRIRLAIFYAKTRMGWTVSKRPKLVSDLIDGEDARPRLNNKIARLARGLKAGETGGSSAGECDTIIKFCRQDKSVRRVHGGNRAGAATCSAMKTQTALLD